MRLSRAASTATFFAALLAPALCFAHIGSDGGQHHGAMAQVAAGFVHPFTGLDHLAAMLALGVWSALTSRRAWLAPLAFAATLALGAVLGANGVALPSVEPMIAASLLVLGLLLASRVQLPVVAGAAVASVFALFHGAAHGQEFGGQGALFAIGGMVAASAALHAAGVGIGLALRHRHAAWPRVAGGAVALFGTALLAPLLAPLV